MLSSAIRPLNVPALQPPDGWSARSAVAFSSTRWFSIRHQAVASFVNAPVMISSVLLLPALLRQLPRDAKIPVLTYDSTYCAEDLFRTGDPAERTRVVIGSAEGGKLWYSEPTLIDVATFETDVVACVYVLRSVDRGYRLQVRGASTDYTTSQTGAGSPSPLWPERVTTYRENAAVIAKK
ncbi:MULTISPECIES: hypothetical protein [unclassified Bradyrhizobium]|uniref:hypothetical protein n=1 Tax=unclassified Bradyrhizobium TaxID=2631580 RepID=UPI001CD24DC7|nr:MULTISPECIES: hypothetical protein [unclassified Bradyrhizobium]